ncbi:MAG: hypothetical protein LDL33_15610 [Desulfomonile sp.]|nr:hypothetical protein [Desulfomonile sp.]
MLLVASKGRMSVESGVDAFITKPVDSAVLLATIQEIADRFNLGSNRV